MTVSAFELFKIGVGPSSSHTVGPMLAARAFADRLLASSELPGVARITVDLFGSLGATGEGHGTIPAVLAGLEGAEPDTVDPSEMAHGVARITGAGRVVLGHRSGVALQPAADIRLRPLRRKPFHPNALTFTALDAHGVVLDVATFYSVGGGFVIADDDLADGVAMAHETSDVPFPYSSAAELLALCARESCSIGQIAMANETAVLSEAEVCERLLEIREVMSASIDASCERTGNLPGGLDVPRRAKALHERLRAETLVDPMDWVSLWAIAVNEENAGGGRVVTAPTNGAGGIIPAVLRYFTTFDEAADDDGVVTFLLTAAAIGSLYKQMASISGAEVGCQGEVGSACSMAAGALAAVRGGSPAQVENAAEIAMEHNLGLTCDPIGGLVQVPCIERNAIAAVKAIAAAKLALHGDGSHFVSLDQVIHTMRDTGADMQQKYKETAEGGLAVNVIDC